MSGLATRNRDGCLDMSRGEDEPIILERNPCRQLGAGNQNPQDYVRAWLRSRALVVVNGMVGACNVKETDNRR